MGKIKVVAVGSLELPWSSNSDRMSSDNKVGGSRPVRGLPGYAGDLGLAVENQGVSVVCFDGFGGEVTGGLCQKWDSSDQGRNGGMSDLGIAHRIVQIPMDKSTLALQMG